MKARRRMSSAERRAMNQEINRQLIERNDEWLVDVEAMVLLVLHEHYGFGNKRLLRFREHFIEECKEMRRYYEMDDVSYPAKVRLKKLGIDVEQLYREQKEEP